MVNLHSWVNAGFNTGSEKDANDGTSDQSRILFGDFNGDGRTDVYYALSQASFTLSRGDGTFTRQKCPYGISIIFVMKTKRPH